MLRQALVSVDEFQLGRAQQLIGMAGAFGGVLGGQVAALSFSGRLSRVDGPEGSRAPGLSSRP